ncbi:MAG: hypothetical protein JW870_07940 [Candidatus Delongbacteria bacterium]|nr:hypothetical protein [Candidatus Delongbacteria bacterium]
MDDSPAENPNAQQVPVIQDQVSQDITSNEMNNPAQNDPAPNDEVNSTSPDTQAEDVPSNSLPPLQNSSTPPPPVHTVMDPNSIVGPHSSSNGGKGFKIFVIIGIVIILAIWGGVVYLYLQNKSAKESTSQQPQEQEEVVKATPTPEFTPDQIKIQNGSVVRKKTDGEVSMLIDKKDYPSTGITGFLKVNVSPNNSKLCFESWSPAPEPALYLSDVDGQNVTEVSPNRQNCLWSNDSQEIYYINTSSKTTPVNIFSYDLQTELETDLTSSSVPSGVVRRFEIVGLSADGTKIICKYENLGGAAAAEEMSECEVDLETGSVNSI